MDPVISFNQFSFYYKGADLPVLSQLSLEINKGEVVLVLGPSGCGKSTLFRCINGLIPNFFDGNYTGKFAINHAPAFYSSIFDKANLIATFSDDLNHVTLGQSVAEELSFILPKNKMSHPELVSLIDFSLGKWGLKDSIDKRPQSLSEAERATLLLLKVFLSDRELLLFDRPLLNQDQDIKEHFYRELRSAKANQKTIIISEDEADGDLFNYIDRVVVLHKGSILYDGEPTRLLQSNILDDIKMKLPLHLDMLKKLGLEFSRQEELINLKEMDVSDIDFKHYDNYSQKKTSNQILLELKDYRADQTSKKLVLNNVAFKIYEGEMVSITGANGSGKSSLAQAIMGMIPNRGQLLYKGQQLRRYNVKNRRQHFAYAWFDPYRLTGQQKVSRVITNFLEENGIEKDNLSKELDRILKDYQLQSKRFQSVESLSFSEKSRLILATTDFDKVSLLMVEEELLHQPFDFRQKLFDRFNQMLKAGKSIICFSKDSRFMIEAVERIIILKNGKVHTDSTIEAIVEDKEFNDDKLLYLNHIVKLAQMLEAKPRDLIAFHKVNVNHRGVVHD